MCNAPLESISELAMLGKPISGENASLPSVAEQGDQMLEVFLHRRDHPLELVKVDPAKSVEQFGIEWGGPESLVWLEDCEKALDSKLTLESVGVIARCHIHISFCRRVTVKVRYNGAVIERSLSPATTSNTILKWAASPEGFKLTDDQRVKHLLAICGSDIEFESREHIGTFADEHCWVCLDLIPRERFEG